MATQSNQIPFSQLGLDRNGPPGNTWGLFDNQNREIGQLNRLTPLNTKAAVQEIEDGTRVSLDLPLDFFKKPNFGRLPFHHKLKPSSKGVVNDDEIEINTQSSTQWDGFRHFANQKHQKFWGGLTQEGVQNSTENGIHAWTEAGGVVGRGVLIDFGSYAEAKGLSIEYFKANGIKISVIEEVARQQGIEFKPNDIILIRFGWTKAYNALSDDERAKYADMETQTTMGLEPSEATIRWIWESGAVAMGSDAPALEPWPPISREYCLHEWLLAGWGMPIGEFFNLEKLAEECRRKNKWSFFISSMPLNIPGGVASPPNAVAIL